MLVPPPFEDDDCFLEEETEAEEVLLDLVFLVELLPSLDLVVVFFLRGLDFFVGLLVLDEVIVLVPVAGAELGAPAGVFDGDPAALVFTCTGVVLGLPVVDVLPLPLVEGVAAVMDDESMLMLLYYQ